MRVLRISRPAGTEEGRATFPMDLFEVKDNELPCTILLYPLAPFQK